MISIKKSFQQETEETKAKAFQQIGTCPRKQPVQLKRQARRLSNKPFRESNRGRTPQQAVKDSVIRVDLRRRRGESSHIHLLPLVLWPALLETSFSAAAAEVALPKKIHQ